MEELELRGKILDVMERTLEASVLLAAMVDSARKAGALSATDASFALSTYKGVIETLTLVRLYNEHFYNERIRDVQPMLEEKVRVAEEHMKVLIMS